MLLWYRKNVFFMWQFCEAMQDEIRIITEDASGELTEKRSRFIAQLHPIHSEEEAISYIENIRKQYYDARQNCYA